MTRPGTANPLLLPRSIRVARGLLLVVAIYHLAFPLLELTQAHPAGGRMIQSIAQNAVLLMVTALVIWKLPSGRRWVRRPATFSQVFSIVGAILIWPTTPALVSLVIAADVLSAAILILVWAPPASRAFFAPAQTRGARRPAPASAPTS